MPITKIVKYLFICNAYYSLKLLKTIIKNFRLCCKVVYEGIAKNNDLIIKKMNVIFN